MLLLVAIRRIFLAGWQSQELGRALRAAPQIVSSQVYRKEVLRTYTTRGSTRSPANAFQTQLQKEEVTAPAVPGTCVRVFN